MKFTSLQGDSTAGATWEEALQGRLADSLITDPPYCILTRRRKSGDERDFKDRKIERGPLRRFENVREYRDFTRLWLSLAAKYLKPSAPMVIWTNLLGREPIITVARELGWVHQRGEFVWGKRTREGNSGEELLRVVETALVLTKNPPGEITNETAAVPWSVVAGYDDEKTAADFGSHPNHKPFGVVEPLLRTWSGVNDVVIDPFAGSGSIPAAALKLGRFPVCIELEADWSARVTQRLEAP